MGVVFPDNYFSGIAIVVHQALQRIDHMMIADIPTLCITLNHSAIIAFSTDGDMGILLGIEDRLTIAVVVKLMRFALSFEQEINNFIFARCWNKSSRISVGLNVLSIRLKATISAIGG